MALPTTVAGEFGTSGNNFIGPFIDTNGNVYVVTADAVNITMMKATDVTSSFSEQGGGTGPLADPDCIWAVQDGDIIHVAFVDNDDINYDSFGTSDNSSVDTWLGASAAGIVSSLDGSHLPTSLSISMAVRSDGTIIIVYNGNTDDVSGTEYERVDYAYWDGSSWNVDNQVDGTASTAAHFIGSSIVVDQNDITRCFYHDKTNTRTRHSSFSAADPPAVQNTITVANISSTPQDHVFGPGVLIVDGATQRTRFPELVDSTLKIRWHGTDSSSVSNATSNVADNTNTNINEYNTICFAVDNDLDILYLMYAAPSSDFDIYYDSAGTPYGASDFTTDIATKSMSANVDFISCNVYTRSGDKFLAYVYKENAVSDIKYEEVGINAVIVNIPTVMENFGMGEFIQRIADADREVLESLALTEFIQRIADADREVLESFGMDDVSLPLMISRIVEILVAATTENLGMSTPVTPTEKTTVWAILTDENFAITETLLPSFFFNLVTVTDSWGMKENDSFNLGISFLRLVTDSLSPTEFTQRTANYDRQLSETFAYAESEYVFVQRVTIRVIALITETFGFKDLDFPVVTFIKTILENLAFSELEFPEVIFPRTFTENLGFNETADQEISFLRSANETWGISDNVPTRHQDIKREIPESFPLFDSEFPEVEFILLVTEDFGINETHIPLAYALHVTASDTFGVNITNQREVDTLRSLSESMALTDSASRITDVLREVLDTFGLDDAFIKEIYFSRIANDSFAATESEELNFAWGRPATDSFGMGESIERHQDVKRLIEQAFPIKESLSRISDIFREVVDTFPIRDRDITDLLLFYEVGLYFSILGLDNEFASFMNASTLFTNIVGRELEEREMIGGR